MPVTMTIGVGAVIISSLVAARPSMVGMWMSMVTTSGRSLCVSSTPCAPSVASPTTCIPASERSTSVIMARAVGESSTTSTRIMVTSLVSGEW